VRPIAVSLQVLLLMCTPLPQAAYAAVGFGRTLGLGMGLIFGLYVASDVIGFLAARWLTRRVGRPGLKRLLRRLPGRLERRLDEAAERAAPLAGGAGMLPAMFAAGYANLYLAALIAGLSRRRLLPAMAAGIGGDLIQFSGTVAIAGTLARLVSFPGADWAALFVAPTLVGLLPAWSRMVQATAAYLRRPRASFLPTPSLIPVPVPVLVEDAPPR
jgi:hypothetical protein